jgi:hypothetical protein
MRRLLCDLAVRLVLTLHIDREYGISPSNVAFCGDVRGSDFLRKSELKTRGFGTHLKEKCFSAAQVSVSQKQAL